MRFETFFKDLTHSLRMFAKSPAFTLAAVAALTLGIGVNTAIFSVVNAVLLRPVSFPDPDRLVVFMNASTQGGGGPAASPAKFQHYREQPTSSRTSPRIARASSTTPAAACQNSCDRGRCRQAFFRLFGAPVLWDVPSAPDEDLPDRGKVVVLSSRFWATRFNSDPNVIGRTISLSGDTYTIVGVLGEFHFEDFGPPPQVWLPFQLDPYTKDQGHYFQSAGRLKAGVTLDQAQAKLKLSTDGVQAEVSQRAGHRINSSRLQPIREVLVAKRKIAAARHGRRGQLRAAHRVRQCREPAAGARDRAPSRDRDSRRDRRIARPDHSSAADRKRRAVRCRRHAWVCSSAWSAFARCSPSARQVFRGSARMAPPSVSTGECSLFTIVVSLGTGILFGLIPGPAKLEGRSDHNAQGEQRAIGHRVPAEQGSFGSGRHRSGAGARAADRIGAADSNRPRAVARRSRLRCVDTC